MAKAKTKTEDRCVECDKELSAKDDDLLLERVEQGGRVSERRVYCADHVPAGYAYATDRPAVWLANHRKGDDGVREPVN